MIDYSKWKEISVNVTSLLLDPMNPRIPDSGTELSQRDLFKDLIENENIWDLAKSIVENGFYPVESLIGLSDGNKKYVLEGNRRLAALKLLISPENAHTELLQRRFRALRNRVDLDKIKKVRVIFAPSREDAAPIIMSKHTRKLVESWSPLMQAKFYNNLVRRGLTIKEIAEQYSIQPSKIAEALRRCMMYSIACSLDLPEDVARKVQNPREFPMSSLDRIYENPKGNAFLGISFDENKNLKGSIDIEEFKKGYAKIVTDIAVGNVDSRTLNRTDQMEKYLKTLDENRPDLTKEGSFSAETLIGQVSSLKPVRHDLKVKATKPKSPPLYALIPKSFACDVNNQRILDVFNELQELRVAKFPNAVGLMFRSLLEMSLGYYLDRSGKLAIIIEKERERRKKRQNPLPADWHPGLREMLKYITLDDSGVIANPNYLKALRTLLSQDHELITIDTLNLFVHNQHFHPNEDILRDFWSQLRVLFEITLIEPGGENDPED